MGLITHSGSASRILRKVNATLLYLRQFINYFRTSSPYISGDSIADLCGVVYFPHKFWKFRSKFRESHNSGLVFCPSSDYLHLKKIYTSENKIPVLVLGNGDHDFNEDELIQLQQVAKKVYVQNLDYVIDEFEVLPIGIENLRLGQNGRQSLVRNRVSWKDKESRVLIGPFANTHPERLKLLEFSGVTGLWDFQRGRIAPRKYAKLAEKYKFVACPRGNGLDTHRFWETLYRGSIPIVKESTWAHLIERLGIPLLMVPEWTPGELNEVIANVGFKDYDPKSISALWINHWDELFTSSLDELAP